MSLRTASLFMALVALMGNALSAEEVVISDVIVDGDVEATSFNNAVNAELASLRSELAELRANVGGGGKDCNDCGAKGGNCICDVGCGGWYAGVEVFFAKPHFDHGVDARTGMGPTGPQEPSWDLQASPRFWVGVHNHNGLGARVRYWQFDHGAEGLRFFDPDDPDELRLVDAGLQVDAFDAEITQQACLGPLDILFSAGLRAGTVKVDRFRFDDDGDDEVEMFSRTDFDGVGPTIAAEFVRPIGCRGLAFVGSGRGSLLFGETDMLRREIENGGDPDDTSMVENDDVVYVLETQLGGEYSRCLGSGVLRLRALWEAQLWGGAVHDNQLFPGGFVTPGPFTTERNTADNNLAFHGFTLSVIFER